MRHKTPALCALVIFGILTLTSCAGSANSMQKTYSSSEHEAGSSATESPGVSSNTSGNPTSSQDAKTNSPKSSQTPSLKYGSGPLPEPTSPEDAKKKIEEENKANATPHPSPSLPFDGYIIPTTTPPTNSKPVLAATTSYVGVSTIFNLVHGTRLVESWKIDFDGDGEADYSGEAITTTAHTYKTSGSHKAIAWVVFKDGGEATASVTFTTYEIPKNTATLNVGDENTKIGDLSVISQTENAIKIHLTGIKENDIFMLRFIPPSDTSNAGKFPFLYTSNIQETSDTNGTFTVTLPSNLEHGLKYRLIAVDQYLYWAETEAVIK